MRLNRLDEVGGSAIVQQKNPLPEPPQGCRPELARPGDALDNVVGESGSHAMQEQIREQSDRFLVERRPGGPSCGQGWGVTEGALILRAAEL